MKIYLVGGAVRDSLMGLPVVDRDWVVVGATPEQMVAQGYLPVGKDFPVFLHPKSHEEYALARTERKTAPGYRGFVVHAEPNVTLEQDLARRDLTINSMALDCAAKTGPVEMCADYLTDPFGGQRDMACKVLRHTTDAFREDPVRILRIARFAARFPDFTVAPETLQLMREMVAKGEVDHLVAERVWTEISKGLMTDKPSRMWDVLRDSGAFARLFPQVDWSDEASMILNASAKLNAPLAVRFASLMPFRFGPGKLYAPAQCLALAGLVARELQPIGQALTLSAEGLFAVLERCDALRKPDRFADLLLACECDARGRSILQGMVYPQAAHWRAVLQAAQAVVTQDIAAKASAMGLVGPAVGAMIRAARVAAVAACAELPPSEPEQK